MAGNTLMTLLVKLGVDSTALDKGLSGAEKKTLSSAQKMSAGLSGFAGKAAGIMGGILVKGALAATAAVVGLGVAGVAAFGKLASAGLEMDKMLELATLQFTTLLGNADAAAAHVRALFKIAAQTPFEASQIISASKALLTMGGTALDTEKNLLMVGDAAAATGADIGEVAMWVGRAYSAIKSGRPFGEAAMRLQELGILSAEARNEIEALQKAGASSDVIWATLTKTLGKFGGAMQLQANTWEGLLSTIKDNINLALGTAFKPLFDMFKEGLKAIATFTTSETFSGWMKQLGQFIGNFAAQFGPGGPLRAVVSALIGFIKPVISNLFKFLANINWNKIGNGIMLFIINMRKNIKSASVYWETILLPAIMKVVGWVKTNVGPVFDAAGKLLVAAMPFVIALWNKFVAIVKWLAPYIGIALNGAVKALAAYFRLVAQAINEVATRLGRLKLPDWLQPGSPTPLEMGLRGINAALKQAAARGMPQFTTGLQLAPAAAMPASSGMLPAGGATANFYFQFGDAVTRDEARKMVDSSADSLIQAFTAAVRERRR